jgi:replicative DNA helicase
MATDDTQKNRADEQYSGSIVRAGDIILETVELIEKFSHDHGGYTGVPSGYKDLDDLLSGFQNSEFIVIGARPSVGKTALALCMAANIAGIPQKSSRKRAVGFFSLEMSRTLIMQRLLSSQARVCLYAIRTGLLQAADFGSIADTAARIHDAELYIGDAPNMELQELCAEARYMHRQKKVELIFIDYLGLIRLEERREQFTGISASLKALARELDIPIVATCQLGRQAEMSSRDPTMADLRESGSIEQDADVVMILDRERKRGKKGGQEEEKQERPPVETFTLNVEKQRNGPTGAVKLTFLKQYSRFESYAEMAYTK